jgi:hypothetical protein
MRRRIATSWEKSRSARTLGVHHGKMVARTVLGVAECLRPSWSARRMTRLSAAVNAMGVSIMSNNVGKLEEKLMVKGTGNENLQ